MTTNRRRFLQALGAGAGGLYLPSLLRSTGAQAQGAPKRLLVLVTWLGFEPRTWRMGPLGWDDDEALLPSTSISTPEKNHAPDPRTWDFALSDTPRDRWSFGLKPLYDFQDRLTVVDGLAMVSTALDENTDNGHGGGMLHARSSSNSQRGSSSVLLPRHQPSFEFLAASDPNKHQGWLGAIAGQAQRYWMTVMARFAAAFDAVPEGDGAMLDNTIIYVVN
ncbi:MAG: hypothetical protein AAGF12_43460, partial [Myxococcota bacterium]